MIKNRSKFGAGDGHAAAGKTYTNLRIVSGRLRGRIIKSPNSILTHPMGAREKLALFNMVDVAGKKVLDAYAGSGALGIEAFSRGAAEVAFVEDNAKIVAVLRENLRNVGLAAPIADGNLRSGSLAAPISGGNVRSAGLPAPALHENLMNRGLAAPIFPEKVAKFCQKPVFQEYFDIIIADPPYDDVNIEELARLGNLLATGGILALSSPKEFGEIELPGLELTSAHTYARAQIAVYCKN